MAVVKRLARLNVSGPCIHHPRGNLRRQVPGRGCGRPGNLLMSFCDVAAYVASPTCPADRFVASTGSRAIKLEPKWRESAGFGVRRGTTYFVRSRNYVK